MIQSRENPTGAMTRSSRVSSHHSPTNMKMTRQQLDAVLNALEADLSAGAGEENPRKPFSEIAAEIIESAKPDDLEQVLARLQAIGQILGEIVRYKGPLTW